eukprot:2398790-Amphidinium_carterae.1
MDPSCLAPVACTLCAYFVSVWLQSHARSRYDSQKHNHLIRKKLHKLSTPTGVVPMHTLRGK